jgi:inner membrane protein
MFDRCGNERGLAMLIAHLPAGYILGTFARNRWPGRSGVMAAAMLGSVFPDIDMLYFHFVDGRQTHHHAYITHWPLFWAVAGLWHCRSRNGVISDIWP